MTNSAQHLDVVRVGSLYWVLRMRFNMMPLKIICCTTFFTFTTFFDNICNDAARFISSFRGSTVPFWMVWASHFSSSGGCHTRYRTVVSSTASSFSCLKRFATFFANTVNQSSRFNCFNFVRTFFRASICFSTIMSFKDLKFFCASGTDKSNLSSPFKFSIGVCHG